MTRLCSRAGRSVALLSLALGIATAGGCAGSRTPQEQRVLLERREQMLRSELAQSEAGFAEVLGRYERERQEHAAGQGPEPIIDVLVISGGGDWGAFGAGFLKGWGTIRASDPMARPEFDIVTGVSTGALIAPFAFLGDEESVEQIVQLYRNPQRDWVRQRWPLYFLPNNLSFAEVPGLEREMRDHVTLETAAKIVKAADGGRMLAVNTTNLDDASPRVFELVGEAERAVETEDMSRFHSIMLASAGIPGAFPFREIDGMMYVDGGVTGNMIYGGRLSEDESLFAVWRRTHPGAPPPKVRFWVIFNNQLHAPPTTVRPRWPDIVTRSIELATRSATLTSMRQLHAMAEISRLREGADVEVRIVAIPNDWAAPVPGVFRKETMNDLADLGERMGADPASWSTRPPPP